MRVGAHARMRIVNPTNETGGGLLGKVDVLLRNADNDWLQPASRLRKGNETA